jgi:hypothetical protein
VIALRMPPTPRIPATRLGSWLLAGAALVACDASPARDGGAGGFVDGADGAQNDPGAQDAGVSTAGPNADGSAEPGQAQADAGAGEGARAPMDASAGEDADADAGEDASAGEDAGPGGGSTDDASTDAGDPDAGDAGNSDAGACGPHNPSGTELLLLMDRSGSMRVAVQAEVDCRKGFDPLDPTTYVCAGLNCSLPENASRTLCGGGIPPRDHFGPVASALKEVTRSLNAELKSGLAFYPGATAGTAQCTVGEVQLAEGTNQAAAIAASLDATTPSGSSPLAATLTALRQRYAGLPSAARRVLVLVTDGDPSCGSANQTQQDLTATQNELAALDAAGVYTLLLSDDVGLTDAQRYGLITLGAYSSAGRYFRSDEAAAVVAAIRSVELCRQ